MPIRTETGRRVYTHEHVDKLKLVKKLVDQRHSLAHLAGLELDELRDLAGLHQESVQLDSSTKARLFGPNVSSMLIGEAWVGERQSSRDNIAANSQEYADDALVVEWDVLDNSAVDDLTALAGNSARLLVCYRFATRVVLEALSDAGVVCLNQPVSEDTLLLNIKSTEEPDRTREAAASRFDFEELARVAALSPGLACECPNHIAKLIMDISAFEEYSATCVDTDPKEKALHEKLGRIAGHSRMLFEEALIAVAVADGLKLEMKKDAS